MKKYIPSLLLIIVLSWTQVQYLFAQNESNSVKKYDTYKEPSLTDRFFKHADLIPLIRKLETYPLFTVKH